MRVPEAEGQARQAEEQSVFFPNSSEPYPECLQAQWSQWETQLPAFGGGGEVLNARGESISPETLMPNGLFNGHHTGEATSHNEERVPSQH